MSVWETGGWPSLNGIVDLEICDARGKKVAQHLWQGQMLTPGKPALLHWAWKPAVAGAYTVKFGVFGSTWKPEYHWNDKALALSVA